MNFRVTFYHRNFFSTDNSLLMSKICQLLKNSPAKIWTKWIEINRKLRVASEIGSTYFWFLTSYRAAEIVQNDNLSSACNFRSIEYHHALYLYFGTLAELWPWAIGPSLKIEILGFFHHHHEISDAKSIIMPYIENLGLGPDWGVGHRRRWPWVQYKKHSQCWDLSKESSHVQFW
jgi:hypothetical protein